MANEKRKMQPRIPRQELDTNVEFIIESDIEDARSVDISETGMSFMTEKPIRFRMRLNLNGELKEYLALLVWAKKDHSGRTRYGFQFIPDDGNSLL
jgi:hypothetical protein